VRVLRTEWAEFVTASPERLGQLVAARRVLDARQVLDEERYAEAGWQYRTLGRPVVPAGIVLGGPGSEGAGASDRASGHERCGCERCRRAAAPGREVQPIELWSGAGPEQRQQLRAGLREQRVSHPSLEGGR